MFQMFHTEITLFNAQFIMHNYMRGGVNVTQKSRKTQKFAEAKGTGAVQCIILAHLVCQFIEVFIY